MGAGRLQRPAPHAGRPTCSGSSGLSEVANKRVGAFSLGMKQRLGLAGAMLGDPQTLLFDEPANGLDPEGILWMRQFLKGLANEGRTVFVSSHLLSEMALIADDLVVIGKGELIFQGPVARVRRQRARKTGSRCAARSSSRSATRSTSAGHQVVADRPRRHRRGRRHRRRHRRAGRQPRRHPPRAEPPHRLARGRVPRGHRRRPGVPGPGAPARRRLRPRRRPPAAAAGGGAS